MSERKNKNPQQRRRTQAEKDAAMRAMLASAEAVSGPLTKTQAVLRRIIDENPDAGRSVWDALFLREVMDDPELKRAVVDEVAADFYKRLMRSRAN